MTANACPRCQKAHDGRADSRGWATCRECLFCWNINAPKPEAKSDSKASAPAVVPAPAKAAFPTWGKSDEYAPDDTSVARDRPLTTREQVAAAQPRIVEPKRAKPHPSVTRSSLIVGLPDLHAAAIAEDADSQLFDRLEQGAQVRRSNQETMAQPAREAPDREAAAARAASLPVVVPSASGLVDCPVCGHAFATVGSPPAAFQTCPQCSTTFNLASGQLAGASSAESGTGADWLLGRTIRGCTIDRKIGEGGMGAVYHACQLSLDRSVAVKVMPAELARNKNFIQRFEREAKSLARINHPNILHIYDFGEDTTLSIYFMIIEFVDGRDLGEMLRERTTLDQIEVLDLLRQATMGLEMAAEKGVIHRDIKPDNLMISHDGICKVSDFGLAKGYGAFDDVTSTGVRVGTPAFMSPEQCDGKDVDYRSDIYSLGCTCFLALTGSLPFTGDSPFSIMLKHKTEAVPSVREQNIDVDPRVDSLVRRMLAKEPVDRCDNLRQLITEIEALQIDLSGTSSILRASPNDRPLHRDSSGAHPSQRGRGRRTPVPAVIEAPADLRLADDHGRLPPMQPVPQMPLMPAGTEPLPVAQVPASIAVEEPAPLAADAPAGSRSSSGLNAAGDLRRARSSGRLRVATGTGEAPTEQEITGRIVSQGDAAIIGNRPHEAIDAYQEALKRRPGNRDLQAKLADARRLAVEIQITEIETGADQLAAAGRVHEAVAEWMRASQLSASIGRREGILNKVDAAQRGLRRRRAFRRSVAMAILFGLALVSVFFYTPMVHRDYIARPAYDAILAQPDSLAKATALRAFAADHADPYWWYVRLFSILEERGRYEIPFAIEATLKADELERSLKIQDDNRSERADAELLIAVEQYADDAANTWADVKRTALEAAERLNDPLRKAAAKVVADRADAELVKARAVRSTLDAALAAGDHVQALAIAEVLRNRHPRAGAVLDGLPLPALVTVYDADGAGDPAGLKITADGVQVPPGRICRYAHRDVVIEISATGFLGERLVIHADPDPVEREHRKPLHPGRAWTARLPGTNWQRLQVAGQRLVAVGPDAIATVSGIDGLQATALRRGDIGVVAAQKDAHWSWLSSDGSLLSSSDGVILTLRWQDGVPHKESIARRGLLPVTGFAEKELTFQPGKVLQYVIEPANQGAELVAYHGDRVDWRYAKLDVKNQTRQPAQMFAHAQRLTVADDFELHVLDESGDNIGPTAYSAMRIGPVWPLDGGNVVVVRTGLGLDAFRIDRLPLNKLEFPITAGVIDMARRGDDLLIVGDDNRLHRVAWDAGKGAFVARWSLVLPDGRQPKSMPVLADGKVGVVDQLGAFNVLNDADGAFIRRYALSPVPSLPPVIIGDRVVLLNGSELVALHLPPNAK
ncbi:MAG TPA: serine/threonine-protein kinase [Planctomycetota bacterium]|nr:serine/threonine-protein kinase [Planctomycetota bacterium]